MIKFRYISKAAPPVVSFSSIHSAPRSSTSYARKVGSIVNTTMSLVVIVVHSCGGEFIVVGVDGDVDDMMLLLEFRVQWRLVSFIMEMSVMHCLENTTNTIILLVLAPIKKA